MSCSDRRPAVVHSDRNSFKTSSTDLYPSSSFLPIFSNRYLAANLLHSPLSPSKNSLSILAAASKVDLVGLEWSRNQFWICAEAGDRERRRKCSARGS